MTKINLIKSAQSFRHKPYTHRTDYSSSEIELAVAYMEKKVTLSQFAYAMKIKSTGSSIYQKVLAILQYAVDKERIIIAIVPR
jgi:hypothetical protein